MYIMIVFALVLLSPLPFVSPSEYSVQDATAQSIYSTYNVESSGQNQSHLELQHGIDVSPATTFLIDKKNVSPVELITFEVDNSLYAWLINSVLPYFSIDITDLENNNLLNNSIPSVNDGINIAAFAMIQNTPYIIYAPSFTASINNSIHIADISDPNSPLVIGTSLHATNQEFQTLGDIREIDIVRIDLSTYALATSNTDNAVHIINITDPYLPVLISSAVDNTVGYTALDDPRGIATVTINTSTYALVTSYGDDGVQIINITDPYNHKPASAIFDTTEYVLKNPSSVTTMTVGASTYALVSSSKDDGVQIINITDPYNPLIVSSITDSTRLDGSFDITTVTLDGSTYAIVPAINSDRVSIINVTNPSLPSLAFTLVDNDTDSTSGYTVLSFPRSVSTVNIGKSIFVMVEAVDEYTRNAINHKFGIQFIKITPFFSISSDNIHPKYAKAGDTLTLDFIVNDTIYNGTAEMLESSLNTFVNTDGNRFVAHVTVPSDQMEKYVNFTAHVYKNESTPLLVVTENDVPSGENVFVDTIDPKISLIGQADYTVPFGLADPFIPGAIVTDGDPNYNGILHVAKNATLDTNELGSTVLYTYTANPDGAGNTGSSMTRTVTVSGAMKQPEISILKITSSSGNNFAKAGDQITVTLETVGFNPISATLFNQQITPVTSGNRVTFDATVSTNTINGNATFYITLENSAGHILFASNHDITDGSYVVIDTYAPEISLRGRDNINIPMGSDFQDPGAIATDVSYDEYKIIYSSDTISTTSIGTHTLTYTAPVDKFGNAINTITRTVNVLDSPNINLKLNINIFPSGALSDTSLRSATYITNLQGHDAIFAWIISNNNLTIINVSNPEVPTIFKVQDLRSDGFNGLTHITNTTINGRQYVIAADHSKNLVIVDADDPRSPLKLDIPSVSLGDYVNDITTVTIGESSYALATDGTVFGNPNSTLYIDYNNNTLYADITGDGVRIINITNPENPNLVSHILAGTSTDPKFDYQNLYDARGIATITLGTSTYALIAASFLSRGMQIIDITEPNFPFAVSHVKDDNSVAGSGYSNLFGALDITTTTIGNYAYALVADYDGNGVEIINITDPYNPSPASSPASIITDGVNGYTNLNRPLGITTVVINTTTYALVTSPNDSGIEIINITYPYKPFVAFGSSINDDQYGYTKLYGAYYMSTMTLGASTYVLVTTPAEDGLQIIRLTPSYFSITSDDTTNPKYAKAGNTLILRLGVNDTIKHGSATMIGLNPTTSILRGTFTANVIIPSTPVERYATFAAGIVNYDEITLVLTENNIPSTENVFVDTVGPRILLIGPENYNILQNVSASSIPNVTVTDGDPNYAGTFDVTTNGTLDTSVIGSTVLYTYTAEPDGAGNPGAVITRTVTVVDYGILDVTALTVSSTNSVNNTNYAKAGDTVRIQINTLGTDIKSITGNILGGSFTQEIFGNGKIIRLNKIIEQSDTNGNLTFDIFVTNSTDHAIRITQDSLTGENLIIDTIPPLLYLYGANNTISPLGAPYTDGGAYSYDASYGKQDVVGTDTVNTNRVGKYVITYTVFDWANNQRQITRAVSVETLPEISLTNQIYSFLASPTSNVTKSAAYPHLGDSRNLEIAHIGGTIYALVIGFNSGSITILDLSDPQSPSLVFSANRSTANYENLNGPIGISVIQIQSKTYAVIASFYANSVIMMDITNPASPIVTSSIVNGTNYPFLDKPYSVSTVNIDNNAYALIPSQLNNWVTILDVTNPASPTHVRVLKNGTDYALNGAQYVETVNIDGSMYALVASRNGHNIAIININNPASPVQVGVIYDNDHDKDDLHLTRISTIDILYKDGRIYVLATGGDGVQIIDITHIQLPFPVSSAQNDNRYPALVATQDIATIRVENSTYALAPSAYGNTNAIQIIDITNPQLLQPVSAIGSKTDTSYLDDPFSIETVTINGDAYAVVTSRTDNGVQIIKLEHVIESIPSAFSIASNNSNDAYAKAGDVISMQLAVNDTIFSYAVQFVNPSISATTTSGINTINALVTIPSGSIQGYANYTVSLVNSFGVELNLTQDDIIGQNVFIDTISPNITLIGDADYTVLANTTNPFIPGATASDGDPNYSGTVITTTNDTLNTSKIGSVILYTYTADSDGAGNPGASVSRTISVIDYEPLDITALTVSSTNLVNSTNYAKAGDKITIMLVTDGSNVGNATGNIQDDGNFTVSASSGSISLTKTVTQSDTNGNLTFNIRVTNSTNNVISVTQNDLTGGNIIIDTIAPNITLNGANNTNTEYGQTYTDPGATATDASYASNMTITGDTVVDTSTLDTYEISYKAPDDPAGNLGPIITRIVTVSETILPMLDSLNITSNNDNPAYAKAGDLVTITLIADEIISNVTVKIANITTINTIQNNTLYANYTVPYGQNGPVAFNITVYFISNLTLAVNASDLDSANIIIDTEKPLITLSGPLNSAIIVNQNYTDYNATVTDNDLLYTGTVSSNVSNLNVSIIGENTITYTAPADNAGNVPNNATRTITVSGIVVDVFSDNAYSSNLAKSGDLITVKITSDSYAGSTFTSATILGRSADTTLITGNTIYANITVQNGDTNGNTTFAITLDKNGTTSTINHDAITSTYVVVDTKSPTINSSTTLTPYLGSVTFDESVAITEYIDFAVDITGSSPTSFNLKDGSVIPKSILEITISQSTPFESNSKPEIKFDITSDYAEIIDLAGNSLSSITITASDGIGPSIKDATVVSSNLIEVYFDEDVQFISGKTPLQSLVIDGSLTFISSSISGNTLGISQILSPFSHAALNINFTEASSNIEDTSGNSFTSSSILTNNTQSSGPYISTDRIIVIPYNTRINIATLDVSDYTVSYGLITDATIDSIALSNDDTTVTLTMVSPFGTGTTPFIEQSGDILNILGNSVNLARTSTQDLAPPVLVYALSTTPTEIILTFSEPITGPSGNSVNYAIIGAEIRDITKIGSNTVLISASPFISAIVQTAPLSSIQDFSGNIAERGTNQNVFKIS